MEKIKFLSTTQIPKLTKGAGVYFFKKGKEFLYIGKATNIRGRVKNHSAQISYRNNLFINQVEKIGYIKTSSEIEALILEANLIKKYQPKYNIAWRDDKNYFYVGMTKEEYPRVFITHQIKKFQIPKSKLQMKPKTQIPNSEIAYVGPFVDGTSLKQTLKILRKALPYRTCKILPKRACLWYQLGRCLAPCLLKSKLAGQISNLDSKFKSQCQQNAKNIISILKGKKIQVLKDLKKAMKQASKGQDFEKAAKIRDQIMALKKVMSYARIFKSAESVEIELQQTRGGRWQDTERVLQKILKTKKEISRIEAYDISNIQGEATTGSMVTFINGEPNKNFYRKFKVRIAGPNDVAMIEEVLSRRLKHPEWPYPDLILVDGGIAQLNTVISTIKYKILNTKYKIQVMALAKKNNKLFIEGQKRPILLKKLPREIFNLILQLRDEAHRFARKYHHKLRIKGLLV